jgi:peptide/nickel transport system substrate-binding protein
MVSSFRSRETLLLSLLALVLLLAMACSNDDAPAASDIAEQVAESIKASMPEGVSASEIGSMIDSAIAAKPGVSAAELAATIAASAGDELTSAEVNSIVTAALSALPAPQIDSARITSLVEDAVSKNIPEGTSAKEIAALVSAAVEAANEGELTRGQMAEAIAAALADQAGEALTEAQIAAIVADSVQGAVDAANAAALVAVGGFDTSAYASQGNGGSFVWTGAAPTEFSEAPSLAALVSAGSLPAVEDRLPVAADVFVVAPVDAIGEYGGTWRRAFTGPNDGQNADRIMMDEDLKFDLDGVTIIGNIAKGYEISDDGTVYTLELRKGMKWSDGTTFNADNYLWWFTNVLTNEEINPGRNKQLGWSGYNVVDIIKVDETHVQYTIPEKADGFLDQLATYRIGGFTLHGRIGDGDYGPSHYMEQFHRDFASDTAAYDKLVADEGFESWPLFFKEKSNPLRNTELPVISPWRMTSPITEQIYEWERNPYYWGVDPAGNQLPYIDNISMILAGDKEVLNLKAIAGEIDFQHRHIDMAKVPVIRENADKCECSVVFWPSPGGAQGGLTVNLTYGLGGTDDNPLTYEVDDQIQKWLTNKDFRIALSNAVDRQRINEVVFLGLGQNTQGGFIKGHSFYPGDEYATKHQEGASKANEILDSIGLDKKDSDGFRLRTDGSGDALVFELSYIANYFIDYESIAELTQEDFNAVGIKTFLKAEDVKLYADRRANNDHVLVAGGGGAAGARYATNLTEWFGIGAAYRNWYSGAEDAYAAGNPVATPTDPGILRLATLTDEAKLLRYGDRVENYLETQQIIIDNMYSIGFVSGTPAFNGVVVVKDYFKNVPAIAPNQSQLQNPGIARTVQFYMEGGKNDTE